MDFADRMLKRMKDLGLNQADVAKLAKVSRGNVNHWTQGQGANGDNLIRLAIALRTTPAWLVEGKGPEESDEILELGTSRVPLISWVQAGEAVEVFDPYAKGSAAEWIIPAGDVGPRAFALRVKGDSMEPLIPEGSIVIVDPDVQPENGSIVVARFEDAMEATLKRLVLDGDEKWLKPLNPAYTARRINSECQFVGVARKVQIDL